MKIDDFYKGNGWGKLIKAHEIGDFTIIEYDSYKDGYRTGETTGEICFHPFIGDQDLCTSADSLDKALILAIAYKYENNPNGQAGKYFFKMVGME